MRVAGRNRITRDIRVEKNPVLRSGAGAGEGNGYILNSISLVNILIVRIYLYKSNSIRLSV